jgi:hypothetical protein
MKIAVRIQQDHSESMEELVLEASNRAMRIFNNMADQVKQGKFGNISHEETVKVKDYSPSINHERLVAKRLAQRTGARL